MEVNDSSGPHIDCWFTSMEQCKNGSTGAGSCFVNPYYKPPPPEPAAKSNPPATKSKKMKQ